MKRVEEDNRRNMRYNLMNGGGRAEGHHHIKLKWDGDGGAGGRPVADLSGSYREDSFGEMVDIYSASSISPRSPPFWSEDETERWSTALDSPVYPARADDFNLNEFSDQEDDIEDDLVVGSFDEATNARPNNNQHAINGQRVPMRWGAGDDCTRTIPPKGMVPNNTYADEDELSSTGEDDSSSDYEQVGHSFLRLALPP